jgi:hypothetical protein
MMRNLLLIAILVVLPAEASATTGLATAGVPAVTVSGDEVYTLQLASFASKAEAAALIQRVPASWVQEIRSEGRVLYRVNYKKFDDRTGAVRAQWDLEDLGFKSFVQRLYS